MSIKPVRDWLLVEPDKFEGPGGIVLLDSTKDPGGTNSGCVHAIGPGALDDEVDSGVKLGDRILFMRKHGYLVKHDGKAFVMVKDENVMAVFENE